MLDTNHAKPLLSSLVTRSSLVALIPAIVFAFKAAGVEVVPADLESIVDAGLAIIGAVASIVAIYGRYRATAVIK